MARELSALELHKSDDKMRNPLLLPCVVHIRANIVFTTVFKRVEDLFCFIQAMNTLAFLSRQELKYLKDKLAHIRETIGWLQLDIF